MHKYKLNSYSQIPWVRLLQCRMILTHTVKPSTCSCFSRNFSKVFSCMVWICCTSFILIFIFFFKLFLVKNKETNNLLRLSLDNGRLCVSCMCIHKIKTKAEVSPVWDCDLVFVRVLWMLLSVHGNGFRQPFVKAKQDQKATALWT